MATLIRPKRWGQQKPPAGTQVNRGHPLAQGLVACVLPTGGMPFDLIRNARLDQGADPTNNFVQDGTRGVVLRQNGSASGSGGWAFPDSGFVPTSSVTIMVAQRQIGSSGNQRASFGLVSATDGDRCGAHLPWTDNVVYWDFGGSGAAPNRLSASGLTFGDDVWAFTNGKRGPTIWQNAVLKASNSSAATRNATTASKYWIGNGQSATGFAGVGNIAFGFFYMWNRELTGSEIQQLYAEPYSFFTPQSPTRRLYVAASTVLGAATLTGVGSLTTIDSPGFIDSAALSGSGSLSSIGTPSPTQVAGLSGSGSLTATGSPAPLVTVALAGSGTLAAGGLPTISGIAVLGGDGALVTAGRPGFLVIAALTGDGVLIAAIPVQPPASRIFTVPAKNRGYVVPAKNKSYVVPAKTRAVEVR